MSRAIHVASAATDAQAHTGAATLVGVSVVGGAAAATAYLRDGTSAAGPIVAAVRVAANGSSEHVQVPAVDVSTGIFVDRDGTNALELVVYVL
jgi:hypothetical protein